MTLVLVAFSSIYALAEFTDLFDDIQQNRVKGKVVVHFYTYHSLWIAHFLAPFAVLVGVLATFGILSRRNEITAMKAGGLSLYRTALPVVALAFLGSGVLYGMQELVLPYTNRRNFPPGLFSTQPSGSIILSLARLRNRLGLFNCLGEMALDGAWLVDGAGVPRLELALGFKLGRGR